MSGGRPDPGRLNKLEIPAVLRLTVKGASDRRAVDPTDVDQGWFNTCFLMAAMASVTRQHPDPDAWLKRLVKDNGDGTYTVTFKDKQVTVRPTFGEGHAVSDDPAEMWPALIEKAYGKAYGDTTREERWWLSQGGSPGVAMEQLTGQPSIQHDPRTMAIEVLAALHGQGQAITVNSYHDKSAGTDPAQAPHPSYRSNVYGEPLTQWHTYYVQRVDTQTNTVVLHNPAVTPRVDINVPIADFQQVFTTVQTNSLKPSLKN